MKNLTIKLMVLTVMIILGIMLMQSSVYATNENIEILQKSNGDFLIYIKENLATDFEFAFSNDTNADRNTLTYRMAETDSNTKEANKVAFVNSTTVGMFQNPTYMWARIGSNYILEGVQVDLTKAIHEYDLQLASDITKIIKVDTTQTTTTKEIVDGKEVSITSGKVILTNPVANSDYSYMLVKLPYSDEYTKLINLATRISKFNKNTDMYTKIGIYQDFLETYNSLKPNSNSNWIEVKENEIPQPKDTEDGEQYVLWLRESTNGQTSSMDIQFLTSHKEYSEEKIIETITTKLPVTYDNNVLLIVLAVLIVLTIAVFIRIKFLKNKEEM